jgi:hypothetical protein
VRRFFRRQSRFTPTLLVTLGASALLIVALVLPRMTARQPEPPAAGHSPRSAESPGLASRRTRATSATPVPAARQRRTVPEPPPSPRRTPSVSSRPVAPPVADHAVAPRLAIVIDDLGQNISHLEKLADLGIPLSVAVIPGLPATARTVREAARRNIEILLHQPMEPRDEGGKNPGEGVLLTTMTAEAIRERVRESLASVRGAVGVNNHMGSRFTEDSGGVAALMVELREQKLFWLDSRTTAATVGPAVARSLGVPAIERDIFIDAEVSVDFIRAQLRKLIDTARLRGSAVGIGHPHAETLAVLHEMRGELLGSGVSLVPVSALVRDPSTAGSGAALASSIPHPAPGQGAAAGQGAATP